jgi:hypothetical protein
MTYSILTRDLVAAGFVQAYFNSNNAWGFGGAVGFRFDRGNVTVKIAEAYVRHQRKPTAFVTVTINGRRVWDEVPSSIISYHEYHPHAPLPDQRAVHLADRSQP